MLEDQLIRFSERPRWARLLAILTLAFHLVGCGSREMVPSVQNPSEEQRAKFGSVGIISIDHSPKSVFKVPIIGQDKGAAVGATQGAAAGAGASVQLLSACVGFPPGCGVVIVMVPVLTMGGAILGGIAGTSAATPKKTAESMDRILGRVLLDSHPQKSLRGLVFQVANDLAAGSVKEIIKGAAPSHRETDYTSFRKYGLDTVLEVSVVRVGLLGGKGSDPMLILFVEANLNLVSTDGGKRITKEKRFNYISTSRTLSSWIKDNGQPLSEEIRHALRGIAQNIVESVFLIFR
jgi:hypothetical protein